MGTPMRIIEPAVVVPAATLMGVVGLVLTVATSPIWLIVLYILYRKQLADARRLAEQVRLAGSRTAAPGSIAAGAIITLT
jgi:hypothetical protein